MIGLSWKSDLPTLVTRPLLFARMYALPLAVLLTGTIMDAVTTMINLSRYGTDVEVHAVLRIVMQIVGVPAGAILGKLAQMAAAIVVAAVWRPWCKWLMYAAGLIYAAAGVSNRHLLL